MALASAVCCFAAAGCGDPFMVLGEWPGVMRLVAGGPGADLDPARLALRSPGDLAVDDAGTLYIPDDLARRIFAVASSGRIDTVTGPARCPGPPCPASFAAVAVHPDGNLVALDPFGQRIWMVPARGGAASLAAGTGQPGSAPDGTPALDATLGALSGVAVGPDGTIYFSEAGAQRVRSIDASGVLGTVAGSGERGFGGDGADARQALLDTPRGLAVAGGHLYIVDAHNHRIRRVDLATNRIETIAGSGHPAFGGDGRHATEAHLRDPEAAAVSGTTLFIADAGNRRVRAVDLRSGTISTYAGDGTPGVGSDGDLAGEMRFLRPSGLAAAFGILFTADRDAATVWRVVVDL